MRLTETSHCLWSLQMASCQNWQRVRILTKVSASKPPSAVSDQERKVEFHTGSFFPSSNWQEENMVTNPSFPRDSCCLLVCLTVCLGHCRCEGPSKLWLDKNVGCPPFCRQGPTDCCKLQGQYLSLFSLSWLSLGVALNPGRIISFAPCWGPLLCTWSCSVPRIFVVCPG